MGPWHKHRLRVRFEETDIMGVGYYGKFFVWLEVGRISLLRDVGLPRKEWERRGFHIPVVQAHADYRASAQFDDEVLVKTRVASVGKSSIRFRNEVYKLPDMQLLCTGHTVHVLIDGSKKPIAIPDDIRGKITSS